MGARVLVAEDNDDYRSVLRMLLTGVGCSVVEASNGLEAIDGALSTHPDLIMMDWIMPQLGGLEATKRLKENPKTRDIPIVICTALSMEALGHGKLLDCAQEIIQKPVRLETIRDIVHKYATQPKQQQKTSTTAEMKASTDVVDAWRLLQKIKDSFNKDSLQVGLPNAHNFGRQREDGRPGRRLEKSREPPTSQLLRTNDGQLFAG